jgi:hypothetical protein
MPVSMTPEEDEAFSVPFLGRDMRSLETKLPASKLGGKQAATPRDAWEADDGLLDVRRCNRASVCQYTDAWLVFVHAAAGFGDDPMALLLLLCCHARA